MAYVHDPYTTSQPYPVLYQPTQLSQFAPPQQSQYESFYNPYSSAEYAAFGPHALQDEYGDDGQENLTRPRLTKEQVEVLETQFQAHPKPNSMVKRQLALQTSLTLPRVANWFQNRRAKAKQLKKQEEYETKQVVGGLQEGWKSESSLVHRPAHQSHTESSIQDTRERSFTDSATAPPLLSISTTSVPHVSDDAAKDKAWASLQRALQAAQEGRQMAAQLDQTSMPPPAAPRQTHIQLLSPALQEQAHATPTASTFSEWPNLESSTPWTASHQYLEEPAFDFGFDPLEETTPPGSDHTPTSSHDTTPAQSFPIETNWVNALHHPVPMQQPTQLVRLDSNIIQDMAYPSPRRGSTSDELTNNFNTFALASTTSPPINHFSAPPQRSDSNESIDLATRRKRPRPAALGTAAIRSRSYGALSSMSPTLRTHSQTPGSHAVRHVKSTGHSLNVRYAGIRKPSSAQRSPLNATSFAEADALKRLMAQQTLLERSHEGTGNNTPLMSPEMIMHAQTPVQEQHPFQAQDIPTSAQFPLSASSYYSAFTSPPVTPFQSEYYMASQQQNLMPPASAGPQYASFPDYTPPYSAGPLTSSSWSDAPLTSPDVPSFQLMSHMPSMAYSLTHDMATGQYRRFTTSSEKREISPTLSDRKKTEFFIHEFPGQKEEHAHVAQQLAQQKPKTYVFANATPSDY